MYAPFFQPPRLRTAECRQIRSARGHPDLAIAKQLTGELPSGSWHNAFKPFAAMFCYVLNALERGFGGFGREADDICQIGDDRELPLRSLAIPVVDLWRLPPRTEVGPMAKGLSGGSGVIADWPADTSAHRTAARNGCMLDALASLRGQCGIRFTFRRNNGAPSLRPLRHERPAREEIQRFLPAGTNKYICR
jgi:hypothetical protein